MKVIRTLSEPEFERLLEDLGLYAHRALDYWRLWHGLDASVDDHLTELNRFGNLRLGPYKIPCCRTRACYMNEQRLRSASAISSRLRSHFCVLRIRRTGSFGGAALRSQDDACGR